MMQFFYYFPGRSPPINPEFMSGKAHLQLAIAAEKAGFDGVCIDEHPAPVTSWLQGPGGHHCFDPFVCLASVAAVTTTLKVLTYLTVVPYRHPFLFAKTATSLDVMSDGRLVLGVGLGYMKGEFDALDIDFNDRNRLFEASMDIFRKCCTGEAVRFDENSGESVVMQPRPIQRPHPPLWIGGTSKASRKRAVDFGQGWMPTPRPRNHAYHKTPPLENTDDLRELSRWMLDYAEQVGRKEPIEIIVSGLMIDSKASDTGQAEQIAALQDLGVTAITINGQGQSLAEALTFIQRYGTNVINQVRPRKRTT